MSVTNVVLGGEGLIGRALRRRLRAAGEAVVSYDLVAGTDLSLVEPPPPLGAAFYWFLAWDVGGARYLMDRDPGAQHRSLAASVALAQRVFGWLAARRARFLFTGTQMAGYPNAYGQSKALGAHWTRLLGGQLAVLWNVYGPAPVSARSHVVPDIVAQGARGHIRLGTDGTERRQFLHVEDCAEALVRQRDSGQPEAHVTSGEWLPVARVARTVADLLGATLERADRPGYEHLVEPTLPVEGWRPALSLRDGLRRTIDEMRARGWLLAAADDDADAPAACAVAGA